MEFIDGGKKITKSKLIVIDGNDGSGKATQTQLLVSYLKTIYSGTEVKIIHLEFPNYNDTSSTLVKEYLRGEFKAEKYQSSLLYTADRVATFTRKENGKTLLKQFNEGNCIFVCDRYATSNMIHQSSSMSNHQLRRFIKCMEMIEYDLCQLPRPTAVIYLDVEPEVSYNNLLKRYNGDTSKLDTTEELPFLTKTYENKKRLLKKMNWNQIKCSSNGEMRSLDDIQRDIKSIVNKLF